MKKKFLTIGLPILGGLLVAGVGIASAAGMFAGGGAAGGRGMGGPGGSMGFGGFGGGIGAASVTPSTWAANQTTQFQAEATVLGLSESVIVNGWAAGQSLEQIATANGISSSQYQTDMKNYAQSQQKADLDALVSQGTITSAQETQYLTAQTAAQAAMQAKMQARMQQKPASAAATPGTSSN